MESHNNLAELRCTEQAVDAVTKDQAASAAPASRENDGPYASGGAPATNDMDGPGVNAPPIPQSSPPVRGDRTDENDESTPNDQDDDEPSISGAKSEDEDGGVALAGETLQSGEMISRSSPYGITSADMNRHQSHLLLSMIPDKPSAVDALGSGRLIQTGNGGTKSHVDSIRTLLDKWTTSNSLAVAEILAKVTAEENVEA